MCPQRLLVSTQEQEQQQQQQQQQTGDAFIGKQQLQLDLQEHPPFTTTTILSPPCSDEDDLNHRTDVNGLQQQQQQQQGMVTPSAPQTPISCPSLTEDQESFIATTENNIHTPSSTASSIPSTPPTPSLHPNDSNSSSTFISPVDESAITLLMLKESNISSTAGASPCAPPSADLISSKLDKIQLSPLAMIACHIILRLVAQRWRHGLALAKQMKESDLDTNLPINSSDILPSLDNATPPTIHLHLHRLKRFASIALRHSRPSTPHLLMHGLLLVHRIVSVQGPLPLALSSPTRLLLAGLMLSEAHLSDTQTSASVWSRVAGIQEGPHGVAAIKREALQILAYDVGAKEEEYSAWVKAVKKCFEKPPQMAQQSPHQTREHHTQKHRNFAASAASATSQGYIEAMEGATIAAARSTMEMIMAVRRARALLAQAKEASTCPGISKSTTSATSLKHELEEPSVQDSLRKVKPRIQTTHLNHPTEIPTPITSKPIEEDTIRTIGGARVVDLGLKRHYATCHANTVLSPLSPARRVRRAGMASGTKRNAVNHGLVNRERTITDIAQVPTAVEMTPSLWMRTVMTVESADGMEVDGR
ncbi:hypothetical protein HDU97_004768 [Phlyctochytrium planicorne]|nr:hypothetical protein HDU97_004768 [Phlyctochytrium planicorne]